jgi:hypothetical protein
MFDSVTWSSSDTLKQTEAAFRRLGYSVQLLPPWHDVDTFRDLQRLADEPDIPPRTRAWLEKNTYLFPSSAKDRRQPVSISRRS